MYSAAQMKLLFLTVMLSTIIAITPFSTDLYLPAMTNMASDFKVHITLIQQSLSLFFAGFGLGMFIFGPLIDRWGRRQFVIWGIFGFMLASVLAAFSTQIEWFLTLRFIQALSGAAATVAIPGYIKELYGKDTPKGMSYVNLIMMLAPLIAPLVGSLIMGLGQWNLIFLFLAGYGLIIFILSVVWLRFPSDHQSHNRSQLSFIKNYQMVFSTPGVKLDILTSFFASFAFFCYITDSSFVFMQVFGLDKYTFSLIFASNVGALILGSFINGRLLDRYGSAKLLAAATLLAMMTASGLVTVNVLGLSYYYTILTLLPFMGCLWVMSVNADSIVYMQFKKEVGTASAVIGTLKFGSGALSGPLLALFHSGTAVPFSGLLLSAVVMACLCQWMNAFLKSRR
ncbi:multidrug effflux MFS transporter [Shewanella surugensis]|uniref:Bcr/CflA family efflux transporter n=1 Tax=Shewanella surugensis TaxID=212020 RepID=A0ABT0LIP4_9GAMM|nr:multidrug effflux MFS transporter [Shewanella surugensis]MCL1127535.1 multidrug effflux MFS transporter [Shewanella surugensis]